MSADDRPPDPAAADDERLDPVAVDVYPDGVFALSERYDALEGEDGRTTVYDRENPEAWIRSEVAVALDDGVSMR